MPDDFFAKKQAEAASRMGAHDEYVRSRMEQLRDRAASKAFAREPQGNEQVVQGAGGYTYFFDPDARSVYIAEAPDGRGVGTTMDSSSRNQGAYKAILAEIESKAAGKAAGKMRDNLSGAQLQTLEQGVGSQSEMGGANLWKDKMPG